MIYSLIEHFKTGRISNVVEYGYDQRLEPPYIVIRGEADGLGRGQILRIIVHMLPRQNKFLREFISKDITLLMRTFIPISSSGNRNIIFTEQDYIDIVVDNDDGTISMERRFLMPSRFF